MTFGGFQMVFPKVHRTPWRIPSEQMVLIYSFDMPLRQLETK